jgi:hypothetical protein
MARPPTAANICHTNGLAVVQAALEAVAEQRAHVLAVADALEQRQREPHAVGRQVDGERLRVRRRGVAR